MFRSARRRPGAAVPLALVAAGALALTGCGSEAGKVTAANLTPAVSSPTSSAPTVDPNSQPSTDPTVDDSTTTDPTVSPTVTTKRPKVTKKAVATTTTVKAGKPTASATKKPTATPTPSASLDADVAEAVVHTTAALKAASSVHVSGKVVTKAGTFGVDLKDGANGGGTFTYAKGSIEVLRVGTDLYLSPDDAFFSGHGHPELVATYQGKWMHIVPEDPAYANILPLTYASTWTKVLTSVQYRSAADGGTVGGVPTVAITGGTGAKAATVSVSTAEPTLPVRAVSGDKLDTLSFDGWNATALSQPAPTALIDEPDDKVIDVPTFPEATAEAFSALWNS